MDRFTASMQFSNHTGCGRWKGRVFDDAMIDEAMECIAKRGALQGRIPLFEPVF